MSDDLISRQALIHQIAIKYDTQYRAYSFDLMIDEVQNQPTSYNLEKVIEQLQKSKTRMSCYRLNNVADDRISIDEAIEIVRKVGID